MDASLLSRLMQISEAGVVPMRLVELTKRNGSKVVINVAHVVHLASLANHTRISFAFAFTPKEVEGQLAYYLDVQEELEDVVKAMQETPAFA